MIRLRHRANKFGCFGKSRTKVHPSFYSLSFPFHYSLPATDPTVLHRVLERCRVSMDFRTATKIHARVVVLGFSTYPSIVASLISIYAQCHQPHIALHVFSRVLDLFSMNLVIESLMKGGQCDVPRCLAKCLLEMWSRGTPWLEVTSKTRVSSMR
ncbi:hypothetical protein GLYMA_15G149502v4 [Glycine max]|nr:hypothetical protein GLYMA_15G149502v4 [Glycine max]KAH1147241.1 hypothetical protein GYH30_042418 [Glycine max]|eukprot:XP_025981461.1 pentatricopeptide repeat-containing protein At5g50990-like [Glycine max]